MKIENRFGNGGIVAFSYSNTEILIKEETWLYPELSFIAEVGGALGLFLGFSFLGLSESIISLIEFIQNKIRQINKSS